MDKGMCLIQSNKTKKGWAVVYPDTSTPSLPLCLEVCVGRVQVSAACDQNFVRDSPPCVMAFRGVILGP